LPRIVRLVARLVLSVPVVLDVFVESKRLPKIRIKQYIMKERLLCHFTYNSI
jgi:hypothetical protein